MAQQARFQQNEWSVYIPKSQEGDPIGQPTSPRQETMMRRPVSVGMAAMGYVGYRVGSTVIRNVRQEIDAQGNEELSRGIEGLFAGISTATNYAIAAKAGAMWGGAIGAAVMVGAQVGMEAYDSITSRRDIRRQHQDMEYERKLKGARTNYMNFTGGYYG